MVFPTSIWVASVVLAAVSLNLMLYLIVRRVLLNRREARQAARRERVTTLAVQYLYRDLSAREIAAALKGKDRNTLRDAVRDLRQLIRGDYRQRLIDLLDELNLIDSEIAVLKNGKANERWEAAVSLSSFRQSRVIRALQTALDDSDPDVRLAAAESLVELGAAPSVRVLLRKLEAGTRQRSHALKRLFRKLVPTATAELAELLRTDVPDLVKVWALDALGGSGDYSLLDTVCALCTHDSTEVRAATFRALAKLGHPAALPAVKKGLTDPDWEVRAQAAICAGSIGLREAIPALTSLLEDGNPWVQYRAAEALYALGPPGRGTLKEASRGASNGSRVARTVIAEKSAVA